MSPLSAGDAGGRGPQDTWGRSERTSTAAAGRGTQNRAPGPPLAALGSGLQGSGSQRSFSKAGPQGRTALGLHALWACRGGVPWLRVQLQEACPAPPKVQQLQAQARVKSPGGCAQGSGSWHSPGISRTRALRLFSGSHPGSAWQVCTHPCRPLDLLQGGRVRPAAPGLGSLP